MCENSRQRVIHISTAVAVNFLRLQVALAVSGDSMYPTLADGDTILVDLTQRSPSRDGIYIVRFGEFVLVKRLHVDPTRRLITISCDNTHYPPLAPVAPDDVEVAGRVIWVGRRL